MTGEKLMPCSPRGTDDFDVSSKASAFRQHIRENGGCEKLKVLIEFVNVLRALPTARSAGPTLMLIATGELEERPYDISSLAASLDLPRTSVFRFLEELGQQHLVRLTRKGRRTTVRLTDAGWVRLAANCDRLRPSLDRLVRSGASQISSGETSGKSE